jgi:hypothetical protein
MTLKTESIDRMGPEKNQKITVCSRPEGVSYGPLRFIFIPSYILLPLLDDGGSCRMSDGAVAA